MNYKDYINSKADNYKQDLLNELENNTEFTKAVDSLFFPSGFGIKNWLTETSGDSFYNYRFNGVHFGNRICNRVEIDHLQFSNKSINQFERYSVFSFFEDNNYKAAVSRFPMFYHLVQKDFYKIIDRIVLNRLEDYKQMAGDAGVYSKGISDKVSFKLNTYREYVETGGIVTYKLPLLSIDFKGEDSLILDSIDVRSLLFLPESSFLFFYLDSHNYTIDEKSGIRDINRKNDEPVIYHFEKESKYLVTNSWENIDRYNKYIQIIIELSVYALNFFEQWFVKAIKEK